MDRFPHLCQITSPDLRWQFGCFLKCIDSLKWKLCLLLLSTKNWYWKVMGKSLRPNPFASKLGFKVLDRTHRPYFYCDKGLRPATLFCYLVGIGEREDNPPGRLTLLGRTRGRDCGGKKKQGKVLVEEVKHFVPIKQFSSATVCWGKSGSHLGKCPRKHGTRA